MRHILKPYFVVSVLRFIRVSIFRCERLSSWANAIILYLSTNRQIAT